MSGAKAVQPVQIFTDGSCIGNPGPGGWAAILRYGDTTRELSGGFQATTNNRMELRAAIEGLAALKRPCLVELYSDSQYVRRGITEWTRLWQANGWKTAAKQPVKNRDLWERLDALVTRHDVRFVKVKGHADDALNNRVDGLAVEAMRARMAEAAG